MSLHEELNRIGYEMAQRRLRAAEGFARSALIQTPYTGETAAEFAKRIRFIAERNYPELIVRLGDHQKQEILPLADNCGCDPDGDGYDDDHCESDEGGEYLCTRKHLGFVCASCENEDGNGPSWRPDRYEWPCPAVAKLDAADEGAAAVAAQGALPVPVGDQPQPLDDQRLTEIAARVKAATPGPWGIYESGSMIDIAADLRETGCGYRARREIARLEDEPLDNDPTHREWTAEQDWAQVQADAEFIAQAPADMAALLAEVRRLKAQRTFLLNQIRIKDARSGEADRAVRQFLRGEEA